MLWGVQGGKTTSPSASGLYCLQSQRIHVAGPRVVHGFAFPC